MQRDRRDFLKLCGLAGLGVAVPLRFPWATGAEARNAPYDGPYYVVINAEGGWDTTYLMDPKGINEINHLYKEGDILTKGAHKFAPTDKHKQAGMSNEEFFGEFGDDLLVLNGLDYSVNNHAPGARYMATGKLDSTAYPTFAALVAGCKGLACPLSFLTFGGYSATGNLVAMSRVPYLPSLRSLANADALEGNERSPYHDRFALDRIERTLEANLQTRSAPPRLPRAERAENMLFAAQANSLSLARVTPHLSRDIPRERLAQHAEIALASFKAGVCVSANLNIAGFDSHDDNDNKQMRLIPELLAGVAYLIRRAESLKIRDRLVVIVQSEMGRTPDYRRGTGKDHWSVGSVMFLGRGIKGNRVIGATDEKLFGVPLNPQTLACDKDKCIRVRPEQVHAALRELAGIADHAFSRRFPLGPGSLALPENEKLQGLWGT